MKLTVKDTETETARLRRYIYFEGMAIVALYFCVGMMLYQATAALYDESVHGIVGVEATKVEIPINQLNDRSLQQAEQKSCDDEKVSESYRGFLTGII